MTEPLAMITLKTAAHSLSFRLVGDDVDEVAISLDETEVRFPLEEFCEWLDRVQTVEAIIEASGRR